MGFSPLNDEIGESLRLDGLPGLIVDAVSHKLNTPLGNLARGVPIADDARQGGVADHGDRVGLEVVN